MILMMLSSLNLINISITEAISLPLLLILQLLLTCGHTPFSQLGFRYTVRTRFNKLKNKFAIENVSIIKMEL